MIKFTSAQIREFVSKANFDEKTILGKGPSWPKISIVTPSYNQGQFLERTISSVLNQNYPNLEYIIIDGGSTDESVEIIKRYEKYLAYWVSEKDGGQSEAINKGFKKATGDLFNWINSDDILFPRALFRIAEAYTRQPSADLIVGDHARCDANGKVIWVSVAPSLTAISPKNWVLLGGQQSTFVSARAYRRVRGVREDLHISMDMDLYYRIYSTGGKAVLANGMVGMIRKHPEAKGTTSQGLWREEQARVFREYGISKISRKVAKSRMCFYRILDGSYLRSFMLLQKWKGKKPWEGQEQNATLCGNRRESYD
jgi:glycosyltransferase involved in cell wall biosynthesis